MSFLLPALSSGWDVDRTILAEEKKVVCIRFGHTHEPECMLMDETLAAVAPKVVRFCTIATVDIREVPDFNELYELDDGGAFKVMFFYRNRPIQVDYSSGENNYLTFVIPAEEFIEVVETVYRGASKGRGLVVAPKDYSTRYAY
jgi:U5 snRNP protein, DIM1 family